MQKEIELDEDGMNRVELKKLGYKGKQLDIIAHYYSCLMGDETTVNQALRWTSKHFSFMAPSDVKKLVAESLRKEGLNEQEIKDELD